MACDYCKGMKCLITRSEHLSLKQDAYTGIEVCVDGNELDIDCVADTYEPNFTEIQIPINFCPMCGERLREIAEQGISANENTRTKAPHWIVDEHGFGGTYYQCSNCGAMHWDILKDVDTSGPCPYCNAPLHEGETVYMKDGKVEE